jgi:hypothetical protein
LQMCIFAHMRANQRFAKSMGQKCLVQAHIAT